MKLRNPFARPQHPYERELDKNLAMRKRRREITRELQEARQ